MSTPKSPITLHPVLDSNLDLRSLMTKRGTIKGKLTLFVKYVAALNLNLTPIQKVELKLRLENAKIFYSHFDQIQSRIEELVDESELSKHLEAREAFEDQYFQTMSLASSFVNSGESSAASSSSTSNVSPVKLPTIALPAFDGSYEHWLEFRDTYTSLIHNSKDIGVIQKFHYLRAALTGNALQVIKSLEFSATNYNIAWELLENRYNNHRLLTHNYVKSLFNTQTLHKESPTQIRKLIDSVLRNLRALKTLGEPTDSWDTLVIYLIVTKLDTATEREWEQYKSTLNFNKRGDSCTKVKLTDLMTFLRNRADMLESITANHSRSTHTHSHDVKKSLNQSNTQNPHASHSYVSSSQTANTNVTNKWNSKRPSRTCSMCKGNHPLYSCNSFLNLTVEDRIKLLDASKLCHNCLRDGHTTDSCFFGPCKICQKKHNSLIHSQSSDGDASTSAARVNHTPPTTNEHPATSSNHHTHTSLTFNTHTDRLLLQPVLLSTAVVYIPDCNNKYHRARAILDSGSQHSYVTQSFISKLNTQLIQSTVKITGVGQSITQSTHSCTINLQSTTSDFHARINCMVLPCITDQLPSAALKINFIRIPEHIKLADPTFYEPSQIDLLLGADIFWELLSDGRIRLAEGPCLQNSKLGWIISGPLHAKHTHTSNHNTNKTNCHFTQTLDNQLKRFWELEEVPKSGDGLTDDERVCEQLFKDTTLRVENGRFSVRMPLKESADALGDSYAIAKNRFLSLERKLERLPEYKKMYSEFIREYIQLGHMSLVQTFTKPYYFLPHHGVFREHSTTTKLRVVFDASTSTSTGKSLNDLQLIGPPLQNDVFSILLRFREDKYVACADVEKMYRQVLIQPDQRDLQLILWRESTSDPLNIYQLNTVTYGCSSAPYLSIRCLQQLASECSDEVVSRTILKDCYVDDLVTGHNDKQALIDICEKVTNVLKSGCFPLRKWVFNFDVSPYSASEITSRELALGENCQTKTLGLGWTNNTDQFYYTTNLQQVTPITKRTILSVVSQIYDPLGLLSPAIIIAKVMLQKLWLCKLGWDDEVPSDVAASWQQYINTHKHNIGNLRIPRYVMSAHTQRIELHLFTDASQLAFGACAYVRTHSGDETNNQSITVRLLCAKSKVAPLKPVTIPRLELCGALLGARLYAKIIDSLKIQFDTVTFWTDSTIVLGWLRMSPQLLKTFVQNRVAEINEITDSARWLHVGSKHNPADLVTRGLALDALNNNTTWWGGPPFLREPESNWLHKSFAHTYNSTLDDLPDIKTHTINMTCQVSTDLISFDRFSSFNRLRRAAAYVLRFVNNTRNKNKLNRETGPLTMEELNASVLLLARLSQISSFPNEYHKLKNNLPIRHTRNIAKLNVFFDTQHKIIRVGGRISNCPDFSYDKKHPILLCSKHRFTHILFQSEHIHLLHAPPQLLLSNIKDSWWPLGGTNLAKQVVRKCVTCTRMKGQTLTPIMGNLPAQRLEPGFPFMRCGVDYAGPVLVLNRRGRGAKLEKNYICVIVCFSTRAVYLDLVTSLSTDGYLLALKRFISRRGKPAEIFSDNGRTFVGALKELSLFLQSNSRDIIDRASTDNIKLTFIPPYAPHFGGAWESGGVRSCKHHLKRVIGNAHLTYEEFSTVLAQIEAILNSRPIHPMSADPNDLVALTPAHFLIGRPMTSPPCEDLTSAEPSRLRRYERLEQIRQHYWQRWSKDYISQLQTRTKWQTQSQDIVLNSLVLIKDDNLPPLKWRLGRVVALFTGNDGVSRVADIRTATGLIRRAFSKICPLPLQPEEEADQRDDPSTT